MISKADLFRQVAAGDDLAAEDAAFLCQLLDPFLWQKALERGRRDEASDEASPLPTQQAAE